MSQDSERAASTVGAVVCRLFALLTLAACTPSAGDGAASGGASGPSATSRTTGSHELSAVGSSGITSVAPRPSLDPALARAIDEGLTAVSSSTPAPPSPSGSARKCLPLPADGRARSTADAWRADIAEGTHTQLEGDFAFVMIGSPRPANTTLCLTKVGGVWKLTGYLAGA